jgi:hypothetical protein
MENKHFLKTIHEIRYSESKKKLVIDRYILLISLSAFKHDEYKEKHLKTTDEKTVYEKILNDILNIAALTVLTSLTSEDAFVASR